MKRLETPTMRFRYERTLSHFVHPDTLYNRCNPYVLSICFVSRLVRPYMARQRLSREYCGTFSNSEFKFQTNQHWLGDFQPLSRPAHLERSRVADYSESMGIRKLSALGRMKSLNLP